ncbi:DNA gyrase inhibitor YacG [Candidatus Poribacteria bacterium]|nr:DNA gyrase inhibitor YacG [Candidatus Poribacteria bacterium]
MRCPICRRTVPYDAHAPLPPAFPFCSARCRLVDLNRWLNEEYVLDRPLSVEEVERLMDDHDGPVEEDPDAV